MSVLPKKRVPRDITFILQARMGATRLPGKMALSINGETIIQSVLKRLLSKYPASIIYVATTEEDQDDYLNDVARGFGVQVFRGDTKNVLSRFEQIAKKVGKEYVCRLTGDSPLIIADLIEQAYTQLKYSHNDYVSTTLGERFPVGAHVEVFRSDCLINRLPQKLDAIDREHVTPFIYSNSNFKSESLEAENKYPLGRYTLDYLEDFRFFYKLSTYLKKPLSLIDIEDLWRAKKQMPGLFEINYFIKKNRTAK